LLQVSLGSPASLGTGDWLDEIPISLNTVARTVRESSGLRCLDRFWAAFEAGEVLNELGASDFFRVLWRRKLVPVSNLEEELITDCGMTGLLPDEADAAS
jgi:hypothetical protein